MFLFYPSQFQGSAGYLVNVSQAENTIIFFKLPFAWGLMQALLLQYFLFVCLFVFSTNCTFSVCNLQGADALQVPIVQRTKDIAKVGFT